MAYITGLILLDAPASALNNMGKSPGSTTDNSIATKSIRTKDGRYPYVSAQAFRYWVRSALEQNGNGWVFSPTHRESSKTAYTEADPIKNWDDDLFGYMRAPKSRTTPKPGDTDPSKETHELPLGFSKLDEKREITRISPFRVSTFVSVAPSPIVDDFGTMGRVDGAPILHQHEFYRAHLKGLFSLDLTSSGTFYDGEKVGIKNLDNHRREQAKNLGLEEVTVRNQKAIRLPLKDRSLRVSTLIESLARLTGGAKQGLHYTDIAPVVVLAAITRYGNHPFQRWITAGDSNQTCIHEGAIKQILSTCQSEFLSPLYIGWAQGFLDEEREKLLSIIGNRENPAFGNEISHPNKALEDLAKAVLDEKNASWFDDVQQKDN